MSMDVNKVYFNWLCERIGVCDLPISFLAKQLYETNFTSFIHGDENREKDGLNLRYLFFDEFRDIDGTEIYPYCNMLEMLIALAERWDRQYMYDPEYGNRSDEWFRQMLRNLGVDKFTDWNWDEDAQYEIKMILDTFLTRQYNYDGSGGGLFQINTPFRDQRTIEIWDQLGDYINDRYFNPIR